MPSHTDVSPLLRLCYYPRWRMSNVHTDSEAEYHHYRVGEPGVYLQPSRPHCCWDKWSWCRTPWWCRPSLGSGPWWGRGRRTGTASERLLGDSRWRTEVCLCGGEKRQNSIDLNMKPKKFNLSTPTSTTASMFEPGRIITLHFDDFTQFLSSLDLNLMTLKTFFVSSKRKHCSPGWRHFLRLGHSTQISLNIQLLSVHIS